MLKTIESSDSAMRELEADNNEVIGGSGKADNRNLSKKSKNAKFGIQMHVRATEEPMFLTFNTKEAFNRLKQAFIKAPILQHFDPECYIRIETNTSGYSVGGVLSRLTSDQVTLDSESNSIKKADYSQ